MQIPAPLLNLVSAAWGGGLMVRNYPVLAMPIPYWKGKQIGKARSRKGCVSATHYTLLSLVRLLSPGIIFSESKRKA